MAPDPRAAPELIVPPPLLPRQVSVQCGRASRLGRGRSLLLLLVGRDLQRVVRRGNSSRDSAHSGNAPRAARVLSGAQAAAARQQFFRRPLADHAGRPRRPDVPLTGRQRRPVRHASLRWWRGDDLLDRGCVLFMHMALLVLFSSCYVVRYIVGGRHTRPRVRRFRAAICVFCYIPAPHENNHLIRFARRHQYWPTVFTRRQRPVGHDGTQKFLVRVNYNA